MICAGNAVNLMVFIAMGCLRTHSMRPYIWDAQTSMNFVCGSYFQYYLKKQSVFHLITLFAIYSAILLPSCIPLII